MVQAKSMSAKLIGEAIVLVLLWTSFLAVLALEKQFSREQANPLGARGLFSSKPDTPGYARIWIAPLPHVPWYVVTFTVLFALAAWIDFKGWRVPLCAVAGVLSAGLIAGALELSGIEKLLFLLTRCAAAAFLLSIFLMARERFGERFLLVIAGIVVVTATSPFWTSYVGQTNLWTSRIDRFSSAVTVLFPMWVCIVVLSFSERGEFLRRSTQQLSRKQLVSDVRRLVKTPSFWIAAVLVGQSSLWWRSPLGISWQASNLVRTATASRAVSIGTFVAVLTISVLLTLWLVKKGRIRLALTLGFVIGSAVFVTSLPGEFGIILGVTIVWRISNPRIRAVTIAMLWLPAFLYFTACGLLLLPISDFNAAWTADSVLRIGYWLIMLAAVVLMWWKESSKWPALQNRPDPTYGQVL